ncbi:PAS domain-containing protein [Streptomyces sp. NPDC048718]|uniref:PAS domain-containing protein n=1 Tax=Streptomyces sp. NPDC048718 TaxID=3365587 RepID=UPI003721EEAD
MSSRPSRGAARLAAILDALPDGLVLVNCNGTVVNANTIALGMFETPGTALVGRGLLDLLPEFDSRLIPGSMRRPDTVDEQGRTRPARMTARRTDGGEFPVEVTSANLEDGRDAYAPHGVTGHGHVHGGGYTGDELLMLVVRDLTGTVDTEAELARSQRQTEMILRAASEGVVGTDTDGRVVLVNPAFAQILGYRAPELGGADLHRLILAKRADGDPFPYDESPLADTLRSGRKHRVRGQVLWAKNGERVPVDLTTAPVRDGDQLVGAVMTFTDRRPHERLLEEHATELADRAERHATELEQQRERYAALAARHAQLTAVLAGSLRGPLEELRGELGALAADDAGQLWPEANQVLHHLAAGYARMTTLVDNVLGYQRLDAGAEELDKSVVPLGGIVTGGIDGAVELIGPGRVQFAVHTPPIEAEVDAVRLTTALAHLVADVAGVDATGKSKAAPGDSTIVVAAAQRGDVVRIEVRGPYPGGDPVHQPIVRGIVAAHGGVVQTHKVPGTAGGAYVVEVPLGAGRGTLAPEAEAGNGSDEVDDVDDVDENEPGSENGDDETGADSGAEAAGVAGNEPGSSPRAESAAEPAVAVPAARGSQERQPAGAEPIALPAQATQSPQPAQAEAVVGSGRRRGRRASTDAFLESPLASDDATAVPQPTGRRRGRQGDTPPGGTPHELIPAQAAPPAAAGQPTGTGRRRGRPAEGAVVTAAEGAQPRPALGDTVPPQGVPADAGTPAVSAAPALAPVPASGPSGMPVPPSGMPAASALPALPAIASAEASATRQQPTGRRRRALAAAQERAAAAEAGPRTPFALPPADADRTPDHPAAGHVAEHPAEHAAVRALPADEHVSPQSHPLPAPTPGTGGGTGSGTSMGSGSGSGTSTGSGSGTSTGSGSGTALGAATATGTGSVPLPPEVPAAPAAPAPRNASQDASQGRAFSVRTLGQGVPLTPPSAPAAPVAPATPATAAPVAQAPAPAPASGRRRKLGNPAEENRPAPAAAAALPAPQPQQPQPQGGQPLPVPSAMPAPMPLPVPATVGAPAPAQAPASAPMPVSAPVPGPVPGPAGLPVSKLGTPPAPEGRSYAIEAPAEGSAEGPEPLDGPGGAVEVANQPLPQPVDDELPPEPLDNPRRLLVWPAPDVATQQALSDRGYRPVIVHSREEVDAQIAAFPAALFVDPLTGPITRTALQSLRQAAVAAEVPVLLAAGLGQATREAAYGADPAVLLKALAPRDSEQHPSRVLLIEENEDIAEALAATLERRGMQVARAASDTEAVALAQDLRPNLVVMDLMQVRRRRAGIIDWLRANGRLNRTPLVVYTSAGLDESELERLTSGETVLFLAERSTSTEVQSRIVDLLAKIGTN